MSEFEKLNLNHKLRYLGAVTWTHEQLDSIGREALSRIRELENESRSIMASHEGLAEKYREIVDKYCDLKTQMLSLCRALPTFDVNQPDASDFVDNSERFMSAMRIASSVLKEMT